MPNSKDAKYYILECRSNDMMLLYNPPKPSLRDGWYGGRRFQKQPQEPVVVKIQPNNERSELLPYFGTATLMRNDFYQALRETGVDNIDVYEAIIQSKDGDIAYKGYKAFNLIGLIRAADLGRTDFNDPPASRLIDASIKKLEIDLTKTNGLLMFRLAEYVGAVLVHEKVKESIEAKRFPNVRFTLPRDFVS